MYCFDEIFSSEKAFSYSSLVIISLLNVKKLTLGVIFANMLKTTELTVQSAVLVTFSNQNKSVVLVDNNSKVNLMKNHQKSSA